MATHNDIEVILDLAALKRAQYAEYNPQFHRPAPDARNLHRPFVASQLEREHTIALVDDENGAIHGFIIASLGPAPPVYDIGGLNAGVDDFMVRDPSLWATVGRALLDEARARARNGGAVQVVVVCGPRDEPKREMLRAAGLSVKSEWFAGTA